MSSTGRGVSRKKRWYCDQSRIVARQVLALGNAYCTSTSSAMSGAIAERTAAPPVHGAADIQLFPEGLDPQRIFSNQHFRQSLPHRMRTGGENAGPGNPGVEICFPNTRDPFICMNLNHDIVLGRAC